MTTNNEILHNDIRKNRINEINKSDFGKNTSNEMIQEVISKNSSKRKEKLDNFRTDKSINNEDMTN